MQLSQQQRLETAYELIEDGEHIDDAIAIFTELANEGNVSAQFCLARFYWEGLYTEQDNQKAIHYYRLCGFAGHPFAQFWLGNNYYYGTKTAVDYNEAVFWYKKAADNNIPLAMYHLALCYMCGTGIEANREKSLEYMHCAADNGVLEAVIYFAEAYADSVAQGKTDASLKRYLTKLETDYVYKMYEDSYIALRFADMYYEGNLLEQNFNKAFELYSQPFLMNNKQAMFRRAECMQYGRGTKIDIKSSIELYKKLAATNNLAKYRLEQLKEES